VELDGSFSPLPPSKSCLAHWQERRVEASKGEGDEDQADEDDDDQGDEDDGDAETADPER
jgi:hypothetical protein